MECVEEYSYRTSWTIDGNIVLTENRAHLKLSAVKAWYKFTASAQGVISHPDPKGKVLTSMLNQSSARSPSLVANEEARSQEILLCEPLATMSTTRHKAAGED